MTLTNLGFETGVAGSPGLAASWSLVATSLAEEYAGYDAGTYDEAWDGFELGWGTSGWLAVLGATDEAEYSAGLVIPAPVFEAFALGWGNDFWITDLGGTAAATYDPDPFEDFEQAWSNSSWSATLGATTTAVYEAEAFEDFNEAWSNDTWTTALGATTAATYNGGADAFDSFEDVWPPVAFIVDPTSNTLTAVGHGIANGTRVRVRSSGRPPANLSPELDYYVVNTAANTLQLAPTVGGAAVDIGDQGGGSHELLVDPSLYWNDILI